jgi:hypothetical protein
VKVTFHVSQNVGVVSVYVFMDIDVFFKFLEVAYTGGGVSVLLVDVFAVSL